MSTNSRSYEHAQFPAGTRVYIDPAITELYPLTSIGGQTVEACVGTIYEGLEPFEDITRSVPVRFQDTVYYVEEQYVSRKG